MPIKGVILLFAAAMVIAFFYRKEIYNWIEKNFKN